jgi:hypothetical protein
MNRKKDENRTPLAPYTGKAFAYVSIALTIAAIAAFGLMFTKLGIYALISSVLLSLASLTFANVQKKNNFKNLIFVTVCAYVALGLSVAVFAGGIIWSAVK